MTEEIPFQKLILEQLALEQPLTHNQVAYRILNSLGDLQIMGNASPIWDDIDKLTKRGDLVSYSQCLPKRTDEDKEYDPSEIGLDLICMTSDYAHLHFNSDIK